MNVTTCGGQRGSVVLCVHLVIVIVDTLTSDERDDVRRPEGLCRIPEKDARCTVVVEAALRVGPVSGRPWWVRVGSKEVIRLSTEVHVRINPRMFIHAYGGNRKEQKLQCRVAAEQLCSSARFRVGLWVRRLNTWVHGWMDPLHGG